MIELFVKLGNGDIFRRVNNIDNKMVPNEHGFQLVWKNQNVTVISETKMDTPPDGYRFSESNPPYETNLVSKDGVKKIWVHLLVPAKKTTEIDEILKLAQDSQF